MSAVVNTAKLIDDITRDGFEVQVQYSNLAHVLHTPIESLSVADVSVIDGFFERVAKLWAQIEVFQAKKYGHVALAVDSFNVAGQGIMQAMIPKKDILVSQGLYQRDRTRMTVVPSPEFYVAHYTEELEDFRHTEPPLVNRGLSRLDLLIPQQRWTSQSYHVRAKLFCANYGRGYDDSLGLDGHGFVDITLSNSFFFVGFLEFSPRIADAPARIMMQDPIPRTLYPHIGVEDISLQWWFERARRKLEREHGANASEET